MNCPECNTWNPEDKEVCWRWQTDLPKPVEKKKRQTAMFAGLPVWMWVLLVLFFFITTFSQCFVGGLPAPG